jgi:hypothetical protein
VREKLTAASEREKVQVECNGTQTNLTRRSGPKALFYRTQTCKWLDRQEIKQRKNQTERKTIAGNASFQGQRAVTHQFK